MMLLPKHGRLASARLRQEVPGMRRVMVARTDGIALYDDATLRERDSGAALTATIQGIAQSSASTLALGNVMFTVTMCDAGCVFVYPIRGMFLLAVVTDPTVDTGLLGDIALEVIDDLNARTAPEQVRA